MASFIPNAPDDPSDLNAYRATVADGFAKVCRFGVRLGRPALMTASIVNSMLRDMTLLCEAAEYSGKGLQTVDARYYGPQQKFPFNIQFNDLNLTILMRRDMQERLFFDYWMNLINPSNSYDFNYRDDYSCPVEIFAFDETGEAVYYQKLDKAYPIQVSPTQTMMADDQIARLTVTLTFVRWLTDDEPPPLPSLSSLVLGSTQVTGSVLAASLNN
jgi:hypothetical protein